MKAKPPPQPHPFLGKTSLFQSWLRACIPHSVDERKRDKDVHRTSSIHFALTEEKDYVN